MENQDEEKKLPHNEDSGDPRPHEEEENEEDDENGIDVEKTSEEELASLIEDSYPRRAAKILSKFLTDYTEEDSRNVSDYAWKRFADDSELQAMIVAGDNAVMSYVDSKTEVYNSMFVAQSEFGTFQENVTNMIETTAKGVVESCSLVIFAVMPVTLVPSSFTVT